MKLDFVFAADSRFVPYITVTAASCICACHLHECVIHVLDCGFDDNAWNGLVDRLTSIARKYKAAVAFDRIRTNLATLGRMRLVNGGPIAAYARLLLPVLLKDLKMCLYIDGDVLMIDDVSGLWHRFAASGALVGGHLDLESSRKRETAFLAKNNLPSAEEEYVCSGFLFMDLDGLRRSDFTRRTLSFLEEHPGSPYFDQTAINYVCCKSKFVWKTGWGLMADECFADALNEGVHAIHYAGGVVPWKRIPSWYQFITFSRAHELWYTFCEKELGAVSSRRRFHPLRDDVLQFVVSRSVEMVSRLVAVLHLPSRRWQSFRRYCENRRATASIDAAIARLSFRSEGRATVSSTAECR